jgi:hypothetical protein
VAAQRGSAKLPLPLQGRSVHVAASPGGEQIDPLNCTPLVFVEHQKFNTLSRYCTCLVLSTEFRTPALSVRGLLRREARGWWLITLHRTIPQLPGRCMPMDV